MIQKPTGRKALGFMTLFCIALLGIIWGFTTLQTEQRNTIKTEIVRINELYCAETNAERRQVYINTIRTYFPLWPQEGECGIRKYLYELLNLLPTPVPGPVALSNQHITTVTPTEPPPSSVANLPQ